MNASPPGFVTPDPLTRLTRVPERLVADPGVVIGYAAERGSGAPLLMGSDARLRGGTYLYSGCQIGNRFQTGHHVIIREDSTIGDDVSVWSNTVLDYECTVGNRVKVHSGCYVAQFSTLEDDAFLAPGVVLANDLYPGNARSAEKMTGPTIGVGAQIGVGSRVLPFVRIGAGSIIGSGSVVTRDVPDGVVAYGVPAVVRGRVHDLTPIDVRTSGPGRTAERNDQ